MTFITIYLIIKCWTTHYSVIYFKPLHLKTSINNNSSNLLFLNQHWTQHQVDPWSTHPGTGCTSRPVPLHSSTSFSEFLILKKPVLKPPLKSIMPYLSCSSTNRSYGEHLSSKEHLISDCYPRMLTCVGNSAQSDANILYIYLPRTKFVSTSFTS